MTVTVRPVTGRGDLREFIELPFRLHASFPQWVPPLRLERHAFLSRRFNAFFEHGDARLFLAERHGRVVGRISAQVDERFNDYRGARQGGFGFLDLEDDGEVLRALLDAAEGWLRARSMEAMVGPMDFTMNDECGVVIEGFDREPFIRQPWHPPYYQRLCEEAGLEKAVDLLMWELGISDREKMLPVLFELADAARDKHGVTIRRMTRRTLRRDLDLFGEIYNEAWKRNWDFVPYTPEDLDAFAQETHLAFDPNWMMVAEQAGVPIAVALTFPDINQVLQRMNGSVLPLGWWHFLNRARIMNRVRVGFLGVKPEYQHTGVAALLYVEHFDTARRTPQSWGEMGWILETNRSMNRGMEAMGGRVVKRYRMYERALT